MKWRNVLLWLPQAAIVCLAIGAAPARAAEAEEGFRPLFNGKDLSGWVAVNTAPSTWTVKDNMIICSGRPTGELRTDRMYQNFILELEWRHMRPKGNAGVFVWADDITARGVPFHRGIEVQVLENAYGEAKWFTTHGDIFPIHGARMRPLTGHNVGQPSARAFPTEHRSKPTPQWNHYRIACNDGAISLAVNGKVVTQGADASPRKGYICLESEGGIVHYRNLRIKELPDTPVDPKHVAIADRGYRCLYTGVDLSGWTVAKGAEKHWKSRGSTFSYDGKSEAADASIATEKAFGDFGFLFDVRRKDTSGAARVLLHGSDKAAIAIDPADPVIGKHLSKKGWSRFEGTLRGDRLSLTLNGHVLFTDRPVPGVPARGPLRIVPAGPIDFTNVFVRDLKDAKAAAAEK